MNVKENVLHRNHLSVAMAMSILMLSLAACRPITKPTAVPSTTPTLAPSATQTPLTTSYLVSLQQDLHLAVRLYGLTTFNYASTTATFPSEFFIPSVPIVWSGISFNGQLEEAGAGEDITDRVDGAVSSDATSVVSLVYSRQVIRRGVGNGTWYQVTLHNIPIVQITNGVASGLGIFEITGSAVEKYVAKVEYTDGPLSGQQIIATTTFGSIDWANESTHPNLKVTFSI